MFFGKKIVTGNILFCLILLVLLINLGSKIYSYKEEYFSKYDFKYWESRYLKSQWFPPKNCGEVDPHINPKTCVWDDSWYVRFGEKLKVQKRESIGDDGLYAYVAWEYIHGKDPTLLNAEMPPFGKYLIGLFILVFSNQNLFALFSGLLMLVSFFLLNYQLFRNKLLSIIPVFLFSLEPIFYTQLRAPFLDLLYVSLLSLDFFFFLKRKYFISSIFLGLMMATKASLATFGLVLFTEILFLLIEKKFKELKGLVLYSLLSIFVFTLTYLRFFMLGNSVKQFLSVQKWIVNFYVTGAKGNILNVWTILVNGKWSTWWGKTTNVGEWQLTWLIITIISFIYLFIAIKKREYEFNIILIWVFIYLVFLSFTPVFPRYLLAVIPFMYSIAVWIIFKKIKVFSKIL